LNDNFWLSIGENILQPADFIDVYDYYDNYKCCKDFNLATCCICGWGAGRLAADISVAGGALKRLD
jgi:hypothetical protein